MRAPCKRDSRCVKTDHHRGACYLKPNIESPDLSDHRTNHEGAAMKDVTLVWGSPGDLEQTSDGGGESASTFKLNDRGWEKVRAAIAAEALTAYDLGEDGEQWMVEGTLDPDDARRAVLRLWAEQGVEAEYADPSTVTAMQYTPSDGWWWEPLSAEHLDEGAWLRGIINGSPAPEGTATFTGVLVRL